MRLSDSRLENSLCIPNLWERKQIYPSNYRPFSFTSISFKVIEHILFSNFMAHFDNNKILSDSKHGFRRRRSCESQLLTTVNNLT